MKMLVGCTHPDYGYLRCIHCDFTKIPNGFHYCDRQNTEEKTIRSFVEV